MNPLRKAYRTLLKQDLRKQIRNAGLLWRVRELQSDSVIRISGQYMPHFNLRGLDPAELIAIRTKDNATNPQYLVWVTISPGIEAITGLFFAHDLEKIYFKKEHLAIAILHDNHSNATSVSTILSLTDDQHCIETASLKILDVIKFHQELGGHIPVH